jgi:hypothetical protein
MEEIDGNLMFGESFSSDKGRYDKVPPAVWKWGIGGPAVNGPTAG